LSKPVRLVPEARQELRDAVEWHDLGEELRAEVRRLVLSIGGDPARFAPALDAGELPPGFPVVRHALLRRFRYRLVFFELPDEVRVVAVAHMRRKPGYWKDRLPTA
jgi:hypothetical protein